MVTVTDAGLEYIAKFFNDAESTAIINKIRIGSCKTAEVTTDTDLGTKYTDHGFEEATASTIEYTGGKLHLKKVFTNNDTAPREVWECGAFTSAGTCVCRHVFQPYELKNNNIVPPGETVTIDIYLSTAAGALECNREISYDPTVKSYEYTAAISISATVAADIDPSAYACERGKICFNGVVLPNASPPKVTESRGGKTWNIKCYSDDYTKILTLIANQGLVQTGVSVTGYQYATSLQRYGALKIWNKTTGTHTTYLNCLLVGPVQVSPFGVGWWFDLTIVQSYYGDM